MFSHLIDDDDDIACLNTYSHTHIIVLAKEKFS